MIIKYLPSIIYAKKKTVSLLTAPEIKSYRVLVTRIKKIRVKLFSVQNRFAALS